MSGSRVAQAAAARSGAEPPAVRVVQPVPSRAIRIVPWGPGVMLGRTPMESRSGGFMLAPEPDAAGGGGRGGAAGGGGEGGGEALLAAAERPPALLAGSSRHGLVFAGAPDGGVDVYALRDVLRAGAAARAAGSKEAGATARPLTPAGGGVRPAPGGGGAAPHALALSPDEACLAVAEAGRVAVYAVGALVQPSGAPAPLWAAEADTVGGNGPVALEWAWATAPGAQPTPHAQQLLLLVRERAGTLTVYGGGGRIVGRLGALHGAAAWVPGAGGGGAPAVAVGTEHGDVKFYRADLSGFVAAAERPPLRPPPRYSGFGVSHVQCLAPGVLLVGYARGVAAGEADAEVGVCLFDSGVATGGGVTTVYDMDQGVSMFSVPPHHALCAAFLEPWSLGVLVCNASYDPQLFVRRRGAWAVWEVEERYKGSLRVPGACVLACGLFARGRQLTPPPPCRPRLRRGCGRERGARDPRRHRDALQR